MNTRVRAIRKDQVNDKNALTALRMEMVENNAMMNEVKGACLATVVSELHVLKIKDDRTLIDFMKSENNLKALTAYIGSKVPLSPAWAAAAIRQIFHPRYLATHLWPSDQ